MTQFIFDSYTSDVSSKLLSFSYILRREGEELKFTETLILPDKAVQSIDNELLHKLLQSVHLVLGLSYWKIYSPKDISINGYSLSKKEAQFWNTLYTKGLGEFYYRNSLDFHDLVSFPVWPQTDRSVHSIQRKNRYLVGIGGGKDSILTARILKQNRIDFAGFVVETQKTYDLVDVIIDKMKLDTIRIKRIIDPQLFSLNKRDDTYNGHIPISAVYACIGLLASALYGYDGMITSNERSADYGNVTYLGEMINHQWSKSREFEVLLQSYLHDVISPDLTYFSLLRPYSEYTIVKEFANDPEYFAEFSSCNRNFTITNHEKVKKWCGTCPKCAFVYSLLSACISKNQLITIFGSDLYEKDSLIPLFKELLGVKGFKPFECVGTPEEVIVALYQASQKGEYKGSPIMDMFEREVLPGVEIHALQKSVDQVDRSVLPNEFQHVV